MNLLDLLIILLLIAALVRGIRSGGVLQVLPLVGFLGGLAAGAALAPLVSGFFGTTLSRTMASLVTVFGVAGLLSAIAQEVAVLVRRVVHKARLGPLDTAAGAAIGIATTIVSVWLLASMFATVPVRQLSNAIHSSEIVKALTSRLPPTPSVFSRIRGLIDRSGFPEVFAELEPRPTEPVNLPADPEVRAAVQAAGDSTVRIVGQGCGGIKTGSGFVAAAGLVVTNAHVISGIDRPTVEDDRGRHRSVPVLFDPNLDVAVLRASGLAGPPLPLIRTTVRRGTPGAVLGFPGGGPFDAEAAAVMRQISAVGRDIYGRNLTRRSVYELQAEVRAGNSGGPFVRPNGDVVGVVFSSSATEPDIGYALHGKDVSDRVEGAKGVQAAVDTGEC